MDRTRACTPRHPDPLASRFGMEDEDADGEVTFVVEKDEVTALVSRVEELQGAVEPRCTLREVSRIVERYQEFSQLLDPHLEAWIAPLAAVLRAQARLGDDADMILVQRTAVLHAFATVRGYKTVCKFFPHEAKDLEPVVHLLVRRTTREAVREHAGGGRRRGHGVGDARGSHPVALHPRPHPLRPRHRGQRAVDGGGDASANAHAEARGRMRHPRPVPVEAASRTRVSSATAPRTSSPRLLTRPDMLRGARRFLDWAADARLPAGRSDRADALARPQRRRRGGQLGFLVPGVARALAAIFKLGTRDALARRGVPRVG